MSRILKNTTIYSASNFITAVSAFILLPIYTNYMTVEDFGIVNAMQTFSAIIVIFMTLGIETSLFRLYHDYASETEKKTFTGTLSISIIAISVIIALLCFLGNRLLNYLFPSIPFHPFYTIALLYSLIICQINLFRNIQMLLHRSRQFATLSLMLFFLNAIIILVLLTVYRQGAAGYLWAMLVSALIVLPVAIFHAHKYVALKFDWKILKTAIYFSIPLLPSSIGAWLLNLSDRAFIDHFIGITEVGVYSMGFRIASVILLATSALFSAITPMFYELATTQTELNAKPVLKKYCQLALSIIWIIAGSIYFFSHELLSWFFSVEYASSLLIARLLSISFLISQSVSAFNLMVYQSKQTWQVALSVLVSATVNILLNRLFVPHYGILAAAVNSIVSALVNFIIMGFFSVRGYHISISFKWFTYFIALMVGGMFFLHRGEIELPLLFLLVKIILLIFPIIFLLIKHRYMFNSLLIFQKNNSNS